MKKVDGVAIYRGVFVDVLVLSSITAKCAKEQALKIKNIYAVSYTRLFILYLKISSPYTV